MVWQRADATTSQVALRARRRRVSGSSLVADARGRRHGRALPRALVDRPDARASDRAAADPAARRARAVPRHARPVARVPAARRRAARRPARRRRSRRRSARSTTSAASRWWQKLGGQVAGGRDPDRVRRLGATASRSRSSACTTLPGVGRRPADGARDRRRDEHGQLPRRPRRARGRGLRDLGRDVRRDRALARRHRRGDAVRDRLRRLPRLPAPQLLSGATTQVRIDIRHCAAVLGDVRR